MAAWDALDRLMQTKSEGGVTETEVTDVAVKPNRSPAGVEDVTTDTVDAIDLIAAVKAVVVDALSPVFGPIAISEVPNNPVVYLGLYFSRIRWLRKLDKNDRGRNN